MNGADVPQLVGVFSKGTRLHLEKTTQEQTTRKTVRTSTSEKSNTLQTHTKEKSFPFPPPYAVYDYLQEPIGSESLRQQ